MMYDKTLPEYLRVRLELLKIKKQNEYIIKLLNGTLKGWEVPELRSIDFNKV